MVYLSLLIREKADLLDSADEYKKQIEVADNWQQKALDTKKAKAARQPAANGNHDGFQVGSALFKRAVKNRSLWSRLRDCVEQGSVASTSGSE